ncbi:hypothetical protein [Spirillospora sp. NBC_01491]|uniref:hypothetical protein n=1 Tax=Spirillospora sp. NBC_01491 TaxID=2976007 RepID=UPI002E348997|nr:hypothetical protein [Spirillospora sp. NBC_01491]
MAGPGLPFLNELGEAARLEGASLRLLPGEGAQRAVLTTAGDSRSDWLRVGQALQRVLFGGTARSVSVVFRRPPFGLSGAEDLVSPGEVLQVMLELSLDSPAPAQPPVLLEPAENR